MKNIFFTLLLFSAITSNAQEVYHHVGNITTNEQVWGEHISLAVNVAGWYDYTINSFQKDFLYRGDVEGNEVCQLTGPDFSCPFFKLRSQTVVYLKNHKFDRKRGGTVVLEYLYNRRTSEWRQASFDFVLSGNQWYLEKDGKTVRRIHFFLNDSREVKEIKFYQRSDGL